MSFIAYSHSGTSERRGEHVSFTCHHTLQGGGGLIGQNDSGATEVVDAGNRYARDSVRPLQQSAPSVLLADFALGAIQSFVEECAQGR